MHEQKKQQLAENKCYIQYLELTIDTAYSLGSKYLNLCDGGSEVEV